MALHLFLNHTFIVFCWCSLDTRQDRLPVIRILWKALVTAVADHLCNVQTTTTSRYPIIIISMAIWRLSKWCIVKLTCLLDFDGAGAGRINCATYSFTVLLSVCRKIVNHKHEERIAFVFSDLFQSALPLLRNFICIMQEMHCICTVCAQHHLHLRLSSQSFKWSSSSTVLREPASSAHFDVSANLRLKCYITTLVPVTNTVQQRRERKESKQR